MTAEQWQYSNVNSSEIKTTGKDVQPEQPLASKVSSSQRVKPWDKGCSCTG